MKIDMNKTPEENCCRFNSCNISKCPLHKDYNELFNDSEDYSKKHKEKCVAKSIRQRIGKAFNLKNKGMTSRELKGAENWNKLSSEEQQSRIAKLQHFSPIVRLKAKGYVISREKPITSDLHEKNDLKPLEQHCILELEGQK